MNQRNLIKVKQVNELEAEYLTFIKCIVDFLKTDNLPITYLHYMTKLY